MNNIKFKTLLGALWAFGIQCANPAVRVKDADSDGLFLHLGELARLSTCRSANLPMRFGPEVGHMESMMHFIGSIYLPCKHVLILQNGTTAQQVYRCDKVGINQMTLDSWNDENHYLSTEIGQALDKIIGTTKSPERDHKLRKLFLEIVRKITLAAGQEIGLDENFVQIWDKDHPYFISYPTDPTDFTIVSADDEDPFARFDRRPNGWTVQFGIPLENGLFYARPLNVLNDQQDGLSNYKRLKQCNHLFIIPTPGLRELLRNPNNPKTITLVNKLLHALNGQSDIKSLRLRDLQLSGLNSTGRVVVEICISSGQIKLTCELGIRASDTCYLER